MRLHALHVPRSGLPGLLLALALAGCGGSAVPLARTPTGGIMGLEGDHDEAMADARRQMSEACGGAYVVAGEREVFEALMHGRVITEIQMTYMCGTARPEQP
jgi:hypothetical protein